MAHCVASDAKIYLFKVKKKQRFDQHRCVRQGKVTVLRYNVSKGGTN